MHDGICLGLVRQCCKFYQGKSWPVRWAPASFVHHGDMQEPEAAVAILRTCGPDSTILLIRRAHREGDAWSGHWSLPGGRRDEADIDLLATALRELEEECGIRLLREQLSEALPPMIARRRTGPFLLVAPFVFDIETELPTMLDATEAAGALWIPQSMLLDPARHSLQGVPGMPTEMRFPAIDLPGAPLWGFTYRLLVDWLGVVRCEGSNIGFAVARAVLEFLLSKGLVLRMPWQRRVAGNGEESGTVHVAGVCGAIPVRAVIEHLSAPGAYVAKVNRVEVRPEYVRIYGLEFEEYLIETVNE